MTGLVVLRAIGGFLLVGAGVAFVLLKLGVIGYYAVSGKDDPGESTDYALDQSRPPNSSG